MMKFLLNRSSVFFVFMSLSAHAAGDNKLMANKTLICKPSTEKKVFKINFDNKGAPIVSDDICFGGPDLSMEKTKNYVIIECGDDGRQVTTLQNFYDKTMIKESSCEKSASGRIDWDHLSAFEGTSYRSLSSGYPYKDGLVSYLMCCVE